jgi:hypothetical protein
MPFKIDKLPDEPIIVVAVIHPMDIKVDIGPYTDDLIRVLDESPEPLYEIMDARPVKLSFGELVNALAIATRSDDAKRINKHPKLGAWILVIDSDLLRIGANALGQDQYGGRNVPVFRTVDEALSYARQQIASHERQG